MATNPTEKGKITTGASHTISNDVEGADTSPHRFTLPSPFASPAETKSPHVPLVPLPTPTNASSDVSNAQFQGKTLPGVQELNSFARDVLKENVNSLETLSRYIHRSYQTVYLMYCVLFLVGLITAIAAIIKGFTAQNGVEAIPSLIFAGLSTASFFTLLRAFPNHQVPPNNGQERV